MKPRSGFGNWKLNVREEISDDDPNFLRFKQWRESLGIPLTADSKNEWQKAIRSISGSLGMRVTDSY